jgi:hypothetical protein
MKEAKIIPLFKNKGSKTDPNNYRPIAILSCFSKVIGKIFSNRIVSFFEQHNLFYKHQHGFTKKKGTATALFELTNKMFEALEEGKQCMGIFYDFSKAFDTIPHHILIEKLKRYGINGIPLEWIKSFLSNRKQKVSLNHVDSKNFIQNFTSEFILNELGIGQGSLLGPNVFNIYINDLALLILIAFIILYADDSNCLIKAPTTELLYSSAKLNNSIFETWARDHLLQLNSDKTAIMQIHKQKTRLKSSPLLRLDGQMLQTCDNTKFLGVFLDESLDFKIHCSQLKNKLSSSAFMFVILRQSIKDLGVLKSVYYAHVQSHLQFGILCWGNSVKAPSVFTTQKKIIRALLGYRYKRSNIALASCRDLFVRLGILTLPSLFIFECAKFFRKFPHYFALNTNTHRYETRRNKDIANTNKSKSPYNNVANMYNKLPRVIKEIEGFTPFVNALKIFLVQKCYYNVDDYNKEIWQS